MQKILELKKSVSGSRNVQKSKTPDTDFVQIKKQTIYGHNTASTGPFGVIYRSIC
jgi:hypothetical protein